MLLSYLLFICTLAVPSETYLKVCAFFSSKKCAFQKVFSLVLFFDGIVTIYVFAVCLFGSSQQGMLHCKKKILNSEATKAISLI